MGPVNPIVKLTKYKKVSSMADITQLEELAEETHRCDRIPCLDPGDDCNLTMASDDTSLDGDVSGISVTQQDENNDRINAHTDEDKTPIISDVNNSNQRSPCGSIAEEDIDSLEENDCDRSPNTQTFRSGTLTRRSRRTSREQRSKEHIAQTEDNSNPTCSTIANLSVVPATMENTSEEVHSSSLCVENVNHKKSQHDIIIDIIDGNVEGQVNSIACISQNKNDGFKGRTLDANLKGFCGIGPRGGIRRHSIHSGYLTLPRMTGFVGLTLPDLKTRRKGENSSPVTNGMSALLDLKIFKHEHSQSIGRSPQSSRCAGSPGTPLPNRPSTISYSSRFKNSIGRRRKSITSIENLFKSIRSISSPTPPVLEELDEPIERPRNLVNHPTKIFKKQLSSPSLRTPNSGSSSTSSSCHSSPVPTPQLLRKCDSQNSPSIGDEQLNLEEIIQMSEEFLCWNPTATLSLLKRHLDQGCAGLEDAASSGDSNVRALACALRLQMTQFTRRLHSTAGALEDTARCYHLLDKTYEWALETMRAVGRVKGVGVASPEQVGAAAQSLAGHAHNHPPPTEATFANMMSLATKLANNTLLQQVKVAEARCQETKSLLQSRQAALIKARRQMEFDSQSFVDLNEVLDSDDPSPFSWLVGTPLNSSGRRRSITSASSRPRESLSRCSSLETDDDSVFQDMTHSINKQPVEGRSSLGGIKEVRESAEELDRDQNLNYSTSTIKQVASTIDQVDANYHPKLSSTHNTREIYNSLHLSPIVNTSIPSHNMSSLPPTINNSSTNNSIRKRYLSSTDSSNSSGSSSCASRGSAKVTITPQAANHKSIQRASAWPFGEGLDETRHPHDGRSIIEDEDEEELMEETSNESQSSGGRDGGNLLVPPSSANSHLLTRSSQLDISSGDMTQEEAKKNIKLYHIMSELIKTEQDYVLSLEYIVENYIPELLRDDIPQALRGQRNVIFGNIEKIYEFHRGYFLKYLKQCEKKPLDIGRIFLKYERQFYLYALYNKNKPKSDNLMTEYGTHFFRKKQMEIGDKMDLASYLLKPVQRMGKYALLLTQLVQLSSGSEACAELTEAQKMVQFQLRHGNDLLAMDSLKDCDVNLKEQGQLLRQAEFQVWEGGRGRKTTRHVFLFEDMILFSKARKDPERRNLDIFQYKHSMKMTDIGLTEQLDFSLKFEIWFRKRKPSDTYVLQATNSDIKEAWTEEISKLLWRQALKNRTLRLHEMSSMGIGNKPCLDIRPSEDQINDRSVAVSNKQASRPRLESSMSTESTETSTNTTGSVRRPYSIISVSSSSSNSSSQPSSSSCGGVPPFVAGTINLGFEPGNSPRPLHRSVTRTSQCSAESGIMADMYAADHEDGSHYNANTNPNLNHCRVERSNSSITTVSVDSGLSPSSSLPVSPANHGLPCNNNAVIQSLVSTINNSNPYRSTALGDASLLSSLAGITLYENGSKYTKTKPQRENSQSDASSTVSSACPSEASSSSTKRSKECLGDGQLSSGIETTPVKTLLTTEV